MENLEIIVKERVFSHVDSKTRKKKYVSAVGYKFTYKGELYGSYVKFNKSRLTKKDIVETTNALFTQAWQCFKELEEERKAVSK